MDFVPAGFKKLERLGDGSFGRVDLVERESDGVLFALKVIMDKANADVEIEAYRNFDSPHIVKLHEVYETSDSIALLLDCCLGGSLRKLILESDGFSTETIREVIAQILLALEEIHSKGFAHRDISSSNVLLSRPNDLTHIQLIDMGTAIRVSDIRPTTSVGTPLYMSPELKGSLMHNERTDIYSLGVIMYEMAELTQPFQPCSQGVMRKMRMHPELEPTIQRMLELSPEKRPSATELLNCKEFCDIADKFRVQDHKVVTIDDWTPPKQDIFIPKKRTKSLNKWVYQKNELREHQKEYNKKIQDVKLHQSRKRARLPELSPRRITIEPLEIKRRELEQRLGFEQMRDKIKQLEQQPASTPRELEISTTDYQRLVAVMKLKNEFF